MIQLVSETDVNKLYSEFETKIKDLLQAELLTENNKSEYIIKLLVAGVINLNFSEEATEYLALKTHSIRLFMNEHDNQSSIQIRIEYEDEYRDDVLLYIQLSVYHELPETINVNLMELDYSGGLSPTEFSKFDITVNKKLKIKSFNKILLFLHWQIMLPLLILSCYKQSALHYYGWLAWGFLFMLHNFLIGIYLIPSNFTISIPNDKIIQDNDND